MCIVSAKHCHPLVNLLKLINKCYVDNCVPLLIQQNIDGSYDFNRSWAEYKVGFNDTRGNFWLGNDLLSQLTLSGHYKLRFDLQSRNHTSNWYSAEYSTFKVLSETDKYRMQVAGYSGNAGNAFGTDMHNDQKFSTYDRDNDGWRLNCAKREGGGFWYRDCASADVNSARNNEHGPTRSFGWDNLPGGRLLQSSRMWLQCK